MGESKGSGPHGGRTQEVVRGTGPLPVTPLGMGRAARNAAECVPHPLKNKCAPVTAHSDTTALDTRRLFQSDTHKRSVAERACVTVSVCMSHAAVSQTYRHLPDHLPWVHTVQSRGVCCAERSRM